MRSLILLLASCVAVFAPPLQYNEFSTNPPATTVSKPVAFQNVSVVQTNGSDTAVVSNKLYLLSGGSLGYVLTRGTAGLAQWAAAGSSGSATNVLLNSGGGIIVVTNGSASWTLYLDTNGVLAFVEPLTNGFAGTNYVIDATNGLATEGFVTTEADNAQTAAEDLAIAATNQLWQAVTNWPLFQPASANLTNWANIATNVFASTNYVGTATNNLDTALRSAIASATNGHALLAQLAAATNTIDAAKITVGTLDAARLPFTFLTNNQVGPTTLYGDAQKTNGVTVSSSGEVLSNALGNVVISSGNVTASGNFLSTNGVFTGNGSGLTNLSASALPSVLTSQVQASNVLSGGTIPVAAINSLAPTFNGLTVTGVVATVNVGLVVTNTSAAAVPLIISAQRGSTNAFQIDTNGVNLLNLSSNGELRVVTPGSATAPSIQMGANQSGFHVVNSGKELIFDAWGTAIFAIGASGSQVGIHANSGAFIGFDSASVANGTSFDTYLQRGAAGTIVVNTNTIAKGTISATNSFASYKNNTAANTSITVGSSPFSWTNTTGFNVFVDIDANGATTAVQRNGASIFGTLATGDHEVFVKPNGYLTVTYSVATPIMGYTEN